MSSPIPLKLLVHECMLNHQIGIDRNRNPVYVRTLLKHVRIGVTFQTVRVSIGETKADTMTLFIDAVNTTYEVIDNDKEAALLPVEKDTITWQGKDFTVRGVTPCYTQGNAPHHWEVTLE